MKLFKKAFLALALLMFAVSCAPVAEPPLASLDSVPPVAGSKYAAKIDNFEILIDSSLSMNDGSPKDFLVARDVVSRINQAIPSDLSYKGALRSIGHHEAQSANPTELLYGLTRYNRNDLHAGLEKIHYVGGGTPMPAALTAAAQDLKSAGGKSALIIVSDGLHIAETPAAAESIKTMLGNDLCIYTVAVGKENNGAGQKLLKKVADAGQCGSAVTSADLMDNGKLNTFISDVFLTAAKPAPKPAPKPVPAPVPAPAPKPAPKDTDGDGVIDSRDKCPDTPRGEMVDEDGCTLKMSLHINFDHDKAVIKPEFIAELDKAAAYIQRYSEIPYILIAGHTDSSGAEKYNQALSEKRAAAVRKYLVDNYAVNEKRIVSRGYGELRPVDNNKTAQGRYMNRRVEVVCCVILPE